MSPCAHTVKNTTCGKFRGMAMLSLLEIHRSDLQQSSDEGCRDMLEAKGKWTDEEGTCWEGPLGAVNEDERPS